MNPIEEVPGYRNMEWNQYVFKLNAYFTRTGVTEDEKKKAIMLAGIGKEAYFLVKSLVSPRQPSDVGYRELMSLLYQYHGPGRGTLADRMRFYNSKQRQGETITGFFEELKCLNKRCEFGDFSEEVLRDIFVCGLTSDEIQRKLIPQNNLTLKKALEMALCLETSSDDVQRDGEVSSVARVHGPSSSDCQKCVAERPPGDFYIPNRERCQICKLYND